MPVLKGGGVMHKIQIVASWNMHTRGVNMMEVVCGSGDSILLWWAQYLIHYF